MRDDFAGSLHTLLHGFCEDGLLLLPLLFVYWIFYSQWTRLSLKARRHIQTTLALFLAIGLAFLMANVEFFRYFGSNVTISHFSFITETDIMTPSLATVFPWQKLVGTLVVVPAIFFFLATRLSGYSFDRAFTSSATPLAVLFLFGACAVEKRIVKEKDILKQNLSDNFFLSTLTYSLRGDDVKGATSEPIQKILDIKPLERASEGPLEWHNIDPRYPLAQATAHQLCVMGRWDKAACERDEDGDGYPLATDCNDANPRVHPGAQDIPGNAIDEDCSGLDAEPPNIILIHWEGARAVNVGSIGYAEPCTPNFDRLAKSGLLFRNAYANGTQTRWSLTSVYNSILPRLSTKWIFRHNPDLELLAFPKILRDAGYHTIYLHSGDINFGDLRQRFSDWFETMIDRNDPSMKAIPRVGWGMTDKDLFDYSLRYLKTRKDPRPFFVTIATLSLHHPFLLPDKRFEKGSHDKPENKIPNILRYSDEQLGRFVDQILSDSQFKNTIILIAADHGLNAYAPHPTGAQSMLWEDLVWVPILLVGKNWNVKPGVNDEVRQLADIGPTILDRLGMSVPNHFIGHSLLRTFEPDREPKVFFGNANGGISAGVRMGPYKYFVSFKNKTEHLYDLSKDREERNNLAGDPSTAELRRTFYRMVTDVEIQNTRLIQENRIWNKAFSAGNNR